ncbi:hypothetical protein ARMGADRAFT_1093512 [Armillaria gallica]|uniref:Uncharacterized protein n=1 Tax=Armillaria gallica TaxID=47427 RepID=A0A2H3CIN6_ARMGA|nr:hypothetical protein ARMGADRAFT_1093512 [Armillaria gallica]
MHIFKKIKRAIGTWLLETDSDTKDTDQKEGHFAAPSPAYTQPMTVPNFDQMVPIYGRQTGAVIEYVGNDTTRPMISSSEEASRLRINPPTPVLPLSEKMAAPSVSKTHLQAFGCRISRKSSPYYLYRPWLIHKESDIPLYNHRRQTFPTTSPRWPDIDLSDPAPLAAYVTLETQPAPEARRGIHDGVVFTALSHILVAGRADNQASLQRMSHSKTSSKQRSYK